VPPDGRQLKKENESLDNDLSRENDELVQENDDLMQKVEDISERNRVLTKALANCKKVLDRVAEV
jgi:cell division protein FtsL